MRDSIRRAWGPNLTYFPDARKVVYLDNDDELIRMRHWCALACLVLQWDLPAGLLERVHLAMGGTVRRLESDLQGVLDKVAREEFRREMHTFPYRRSGVS